MAFPGDLSDRSECSRLVCGTRGGSQRRHIFYRFSRNECGSGHQHHQRHRKRHGSGGRRIRSARTPSPSPSWRKHPIKKREIESLLPLVPGVVRGPDGRINMKGAQATQAGWLVNSANVTDPATGGQAINLPIDVVSSVQVISNPYDPEYWKVHWSSFELLKPAPATSTSFTSPSKTWFRVPETAMDHIVGIGAFTPRATIDRSAS